MKNIFILSKVFFAPILTILLFTYSCSYAQVLENHNGEYTTEGGWGDMGIFKNKKGTLSFKISTIGANGHSCELDGTITNNRAILDGPEDNKPCIVTFAVKGQNIEVKANESACYMYCGARAGFTGLYLKAKQGCSKTDIQIKRKEFKRLYSKKAYVEARDILEPMLEKCEYLIHWTDSDWIRNDLAITQYKIGAYPECLHTLEPVAEHAKDTVFGPVDEEIRKRIDKAMRTNLNLCKQGIQNKR